MNNTSTTTSTHNNSQNTTRPLTTPLNFDLTNPPKSQVQKLMTDDFGTDNNLSFNGSFRSSNSVLKFNTVVNTGLKDNFSKGVRYDASFETKVFGLNTKFNLKSPYLETVLDFGAYRWNQIIAG